MEASLNMCTCTYCWIGGHGRRRESARKSQTAQKVGWVVEHSKTPPPRGKGGCLSRTYCCSFRRRAGRRTNDASGERGGNAGNEKERRRDGWTDGGKIAVRAAMAPRWLSVSHTGQRVSFLLRGKGNTRGGRQESDRAIRLLKGARGAEGGGATVV